MRQKPFTIPRPHPADREYRRSCGPAGRGSSPPSPSRRPARDRAGVTLSEVSDMADAPPRAPHAPDEPRGLVCPTCGVVVPPGAQVIPVPQQAPAQ